jgi:chromate reductase, NAD(P)H dehydrogenase (quinone)
VTVLGLSGSLRAGSYNTRLLRVAEELGSPDLELEVYAGLSDVPPYVEGAEADPPRAVELLRDAIAAADAVLIATPEYNGSVPGQLKNALDWVSRPHRENPLRGKPVAVVGASTSAYGALWAQADLRRVLGIIGARVVQDGVAVARAADAFDAEGGLADPELAEQLASVLGALVHVAEPALAA